MARCRIYLFTYKRNELLPRAVQSLISQTFTDWACELHNDCPGDNYPEEYIASLNDERFTIHNHPLNLGGVGSFNLAFAGCAEAYISLLEDDNWWEPAFLQEMVQLLDENPDSNVAWSNMNLWQQEPNNQWTKLNKTTWSVSSEKITVFNFPHYKQSYTALHSTGAMLVRNKNITALQTPADIRLDFVEHVRERAFVHPILLLNKPLANFSQTISSSRSQNPGGIIEHYFLLLASYFKYFKDDDDTKNIWAEIRNNKVKSSHILLYAGLLDTNCRGLLKYAGLPDWFFFIAYNIKHPMVFSRCATAKKKYRELWEYLVSNTETRFKKK